MSSSKHSLSVLLSAVGMTGTTQTSVVTVVRNHSYTCVRAVFASRGYYSRVAFISFKNFGLCAWLLFDGSHYSRVTSIRRNTVCIRSRSQTLGSSASDGFFLALPGFDFSSCVITLSIS